MMVNMMARQLPPLKKWPTDAVWQRVNPARRLATVGLDMQEHAFHLGRDR